MEVKKFVLGHTYDLRTKLALLIGANILIFLGNSILYESFLTLLCLMVIISSGYIKSALKYILFFAFSVAAMHYYWEMDFKLYKFIFSCCNFTKNEIAKRCSYYDFRYI